MEERNHKDTLFRSLFGGEGNKANALELYNAVNGTAYDDPEELEVTTLDDVVFIGRANDVSFAFQSQMIFWEHQSTVSPNMPLRFLFYLAELYSRRLDERGLKPSGSKRIGVETPRFVVFYNGVREMPEQWREQLSECFLGGPGDIELEVTVLNVNEGRNRAIMEASRTLAGYAHLVALVRGNRRRMPLHEAIEAAVDQCMGEGVLVDYLEENRQSAVMKMLNEDYDEVMEYNQRYFEEVGFERGLAQGVAQGVAQGIEQGLAQGIERMASGLRAAGYSEAEVEKLTAAAMAEQPGKKSSV